MKSLGIFGSSGQAREVLDIAELLGYEEIFFIDASEGEEGISGIRIINEDNIDAMNKISNFIIGVGDGHIRNRIYDKFPKLNYVNIIHPSVLFGRNQKNLIDKTIGNIICAGVCLTNNTAFGNFNLVNINATVSHDCIIESFVTISPGVNISGNVHIKDCSFIGVGAKILPGKSIDEKLVVEKNAVIGAGAVVVKNVAVNTVVKGIPAK